MAPGSHLQKDSPYGKDIQNIIREMLRNELTIMAYNNSDDTISLQLMLDGIEIGSLLNLDVSYVTDYSHGGTKAGGLEVKIIDDELMKKGRRGEKI